MTYHRSLKEVQSDDTLARLLSDDRQQSPFDRLAWFEALAAHCGLDPLVISAMADGEHAILALEASGPRGHLRSLANWYTFRWRPLFSRPALLEPIAAALRSRSHRITLAGVPDEEGSATALEAAFRRAGWLVRRTRCDTNHYLTVGGRRWDDYLDARPGTLRTTLKRKAGKVSTRVLTRFDAAAWADYEEIYAQSWKPQEGAPAFLRAFAEAEGAAGRLRLGIAHKSGEPDGPAIAAQLWTVESGTAYIHKLAHREADTALSPGSVLTAALMRHVIEQDGVEEVDFGTGDDGYKRDWMEASRPRYRLQMVRPLAPRNWGMLARAALRSLAAAAKRR
ncbi:GNAT family N-acetyltransferase [Novosphingobium soli]